ncbi:MAG: DNA-directed RNA polymerase subunit D [Candidatus Woesearchaeota archaeon]|nr:DNA-directed RNA polymerase subunit D [Candidatus Woesearchaeota archaeon]
MASIEMLSKKENKATFLLKKSSPAYSNALRRIMLTEVPVMAMEDIEIRKNSSAMYDEILTHRLGLIPLTTDLTSYELPKTQADIDEKKAVCTLELTLKEKGPKTVYASDLKSKDPKVKPVYPKMPIVKLLKDQELEIVATAVLGKGKDHAKWSPGHVWYNYSPKITIKKSKDLEKYKDMYPPQIFNKKGEIEEKLILDNNLVDAVANINPEIIKVEYDETEYIFNLESWGQLPPKEMISEALNILNAKLDELNKLI